MFNLELPKTLIAQFLALTWLSLCLAASVGCVSRTIFYKLSLNMHLACPCITWAKRHFYTNDKKGRQLITLLFSFIAVNAVRETHPTLVSL